MPTEDYNPRVGVAAARVSEGPATIVAKEPFVDPDRELSTEKSLVLKGVPTPDTSEVSINGRLRRSRHRQGERQDGSQASSVDSAPVRSSWWDTSSESDPQTDSAGFSYTSSRR